MQNAIAYSINNWLEENPGVFRLFNFLGWAVHHPIISVVLLLFIIAIIASVIKAIIRLIETASWSVLQIPFKLILGIFQLSWFSVTKVSRLLFDNFNQSGTTDTLLKLEPSNSAIVPVEQKQRLAQIYQRLTEINQEQEQLLQEVNLLLATEQQKVDFSQND